MAASPAPRRRSPACTLPGTAYTTLTGTVQPLPRRVVGRGQGADADRRHRRAAAAERRQDPWLHQHPEVEGGGRDRAALDHRLARRFREPVGQCRRRPSPARRGRQLHRHRLQLQPLQPCQSVAGPVQPGAAGGRLGRHARLCRRPLLFQRAGQRRRGDAELQRLECDAHRRLDPRSLHRLGRFRLAAGLPLDRSRLGGQVEELCRLRPGHLERDRRDPPDRRRPLHQGQEEGRAALLARRGLWACQRRPRSPFRAGIHHAERRSACHLRLPAARRDVEPLQPDGHFGLRRERPGPPLRQICDRLPRRRGQLAHVQLPAVQSGGREIL